MMVEERELSSVPFITGYRILIWKPWWVQAFGGEKLLAVD